MAPLYVYTGYSHAGLGKVSIFAPICCTESFVVDSGRFGERILDHLELADWYVHLEKFPEELKPLNDCVKRLKMDFDVWIKLDLTNSEIICFIIDCIDMLLTENDIFYVKWDVSRVLDECARAYWDFVFNPIIFFAQII